jgi:Trk-type K+ transport system membrane component
MGWFGWIVLIVMFIITWERQKAIYEKLERIEKQINNK